MEAEVKEMPNDYNAEKSVLGSMLLDREVIAKVKTILDEDDFYYSSHKIVFEIINKVFNKNKPIDAVTISSKLRDENQLEDTGGSSYITALMKSVPTPAHAENHAEIVREKSKLRKLIKAGNQISKLAYENEDSEEAIYQSEELISQLAINQKTGQNHHISDILLEVADLVEKKMKGEITALETQYQKLNKMLGAGGLEKQNLYIIMARPSMGKTAFGLNLACEFGIKQDIPTAIFSLETDKKLFVQRILAISHIPLEFLKEPQTIPKEVQSDFWENFSYKSSILSEKEIYINDKAGLKLAELRSHITRLVREKNVEVVFIDYLQLISTDQEGTSSQKLGAITKSLKNLARDLDVSVILLSQLNRSVEKRQDKRPMMSDVRGSGEIEEDADCIISMYRQDYYLNNTEEEMEGVTEFNILKQKEGETGIFHLYFDKEIMRFFCLSEADNLDDE